MKMVLASRNQKKIAELRTILGECFPNVEILSLDDVGIYGEIEENGETFEENALTKARVAASSGYVGVGDDSGLAVDALGGEPGVYSARYAERCGVAGEHDDEANNDVVLEKLKNVPDGAPRAAAYVCCIACVSPTGEEFVVRGEVRGEMLRTRHGEGGFGYDPLFYYPPFGCTFAEVSAEQKHTVSHRGRAIAALAERLCGTDIIK
jgi:XTP/dITP diphosphohydrolase